MQYRNGLSLDSEIEDAPCTLKQTTHTAAMIASHMVGFFTNFITHIKKEIPVINIPYKWEYNIPIGFIEQ